MMKRLLILLPVALSVAFITGCDIVTEEQPHAVTKPANSLVINEVFIQAPPNQNPYYWIEFYNPTNRTIDVTGWKLRYKTRRIVEGSDSSFQIRHSDTTATAAYFDAYLQSHVAVDVVGGPGVEFDSPTQIDPYSFVTIVSDEERMFTYTEYGPGNGPAISLANQFNRGTLVSEIRFLYRIDTLHATPPLPDTIVVSRVDTATFVKYPFVFATSGQIILKDSSGTPVDIFRFGNYVYDDTGAATTDPYPYNHSLGPVVPYQSFARYAEAYTSGNGGNAALGNCAVDFYVTGSETPRPTTHPFPQALSQRYK